MFLLASVLVVLGVGLVAITVTTETMRRRRLSAFFEGDAMPRHRDLLVTALQRVPLDRNALLVALAAVVGAVVVTALTDSAIVGVLLAVVVVGIPLARRAKVRRREELLLRSQMADALSSIASAMIA